MRILIYIIQDKFYMEKNQFTNILVSGWEHFHENENILNLLDPIKLAQLTSYDFAQILTSSFTAAEIAFIREKRMKALNNIAAKRHREKERMDNKRIQNEIMQLQKQKDELSKEKLLLQLEVVAYHEKTNS